MADFDPPFASVGGVNRSPTTDEQSDGFTCGEADLTLFNRLIGRIEAELNAIQVEGGITPTEGDDTTVLQAIQALIAAAVGDEDLADLITMTQAQSRLLIFPEVTTNNGVIAVTAPSTGTIRVPASATILHRGIKPYTTAETDLSTTSSKTYHLRWQVAAGVGTFVLKDLADVAYNPTVAAESNLAFDSTYDDMLVARIVTNSSNVATITNLVNKNRLSFYEEKTVTAGITQEGSPGFAATSSFIVFTYNFARRPDHIAPRGTLNAGVVSGAGIQGGANNIIDLTWSRYAAQFKVFTDFGATVGDLNVAAAISVAG